MSSTATSTATQDIVQAVAGVGVVPVIAIDDPKQALTLAKTLMDAGLPVAEITFRTPAAADVIKAMRKATPDVLVGAGTLLSPDDVDRAIDAGARYGLAPGLVAATVERAIARGLPFFPGVMTPSDIGLALSMDITTMKFFPAGPAGGPAMLKALAAPHAHRQPRFIPTGGIGNDDIGAWLAMPEVAAIGGSWIASRDDIAHGRWDRIGAYASTAMAAARAARAPSS